MQSSKIYVDGSLVFELAAKPSEWLFSIKFWDAVNKQCGTFFDQYEEDCVDGAVGAVVVEKLDSICQLLAVESNEDVKFSRGWDSEGELRESISKADLLNSIIDFKNKLSSAIATGSTVSLSL